MSNRTAINYWSMSRHKRSMVDREFKRISHSSRSEREFLVLMDIDVVAKKLDGVVSPERKGPEFNHHFKAVYEAVQLAVMQNSVGAKGGAILVWLADGLPAPLSTVVPIFVFSKAASDYYSIAIPDPHFLSTCGFFDVLRRQAEEARRVPWNERRPTAIWRGTDTGYPEEFPRGCFTPRVHLCLTAREFTDRTLVDAAISRVVHPDLERMLEEMNVLGKFIPPEGFVHYRYQIDIDGYYSPWASTFIKLASTSVVLKIESKYVQWYYDRLRPWEHFIPIKRDLSDFEEKLRWSREHDNACREIAARANELMNSVSFVSGVAHLGSSIAQVLDSQDDS